MNNNKTEVGEAVELSDTEVQDITGGSDKTATKGEASAVQLKDKESFYEAWPSKWAVDGFEGKG